MNCDEQEERLDRLLGELGRVKADAGFAQRMLRGIEARTVHRRPRAAARGIFASLGAAVCAGVLVVLVLHGKPQPQVTAIRHADARPEVTATVSLPRTDELTPSSDAARRQPHHFIAVRHGKVEDQMSFPAPPLPMTEQERLLRRIAHTGDPQEFATLNPEARAHTDVKQIEEYEAYFAPPPPSADVLETIKLQNKGDLR
jgi:hypothetical protein